MGEIRLLNGSAAEVGEELQKSFEHMLASTQRWIEMLSYDPDPQTGLTPKDVVWRKNKARLYRYRGEDSFRYKTPVLMLYALINKAYILDLSPGMSLIEDMVNKGFDVYLLDWGEFEWEDRNLGFNEFINAYIARAVQKVCQISGSRDLSILGYCMGGTMAAMYAALYPQPEIRNMVYIAAPIDFADAGLSTVWLKAPGYDADRVADTYELIPKSFIDTGVKMLRPVNNFWGTYTRLWKSIEEGTSVTSWKALNKWVNDNVNFPGEAYRQWIKDFYQENKLVKGELKINGRLVSLDQIHAPILVLAGESDHLVLPEQTKAIMELSSSQDKTYQEYPVGHGGLVFGSLARNKVYPAISAWLGERSEV